MKKVCVFLSMLFIFLLCGCPDPNPVRIGPDLEEWEFDSPAEIVAEMNNTDSGCEYEFVSFKEETAEDARSRKGIFELSIKNSDCPELIGKKVHVYQIFTMDMVDYDFIKVADNSSRYVFIDYLGAQEVKYSDFNAVKFEKEIYDYYKNYFAKICDGYDYKMVLKVIFNADAARYFIPAEPINTLNEIISDFDDFKKNSSLMFSPNIIICRDYDNELAKTLYSLSYDITHEGDSFFMGNVFFTTLCNPSEIPDEVLLGDSYKVYEYLHLEIDDERVTYELIY